MQGVAHVLHRQDLAVLGLELDGEVADLQDGGVGIVAGVEARRGLRPPFGLAHRPRRRIDLDVGTGRLRIAHVAQSWLWGSNASRRPSPRKFTAITVRKIIRPGKYSRYA